MAGFDFFEVGELPAPKITAEQAAALTTELFGVIGTARELGSQQDANFLITAADERYVLKVSNPVFGAAELRAQDSAAVHFASVVPRYSAPRPVAGLDGDTIQTVPVDGRPARARLLHFVAGTPLSAQRYLAPGVVAALGELAGHAACALATFDDPAIHRGLQWDLRHAERVVDKLIAYVTDPDISGQILIATQAAVAALAPVADRLPRQAIHGDLTDDNVVGQPGEDGRHYTVGVIDFGDLMHSWTVAELAVTCSSLLQHTPHSPDSILPAIRAFHRVRPLSDDELDALWPLVVLRAAVLVVSGHHQTHLDRANVYAENNMAGEWAIFMHATSTPISVVQALIRAAVARPAVAVALPETAAALIPQLRDGPATTLDLSATSQYLNDGAFLDDAIEARLAGELLDAGSNAVVTRYGQPRLTRTAVNKFSAPANTALGIEVYLLGAFEAVAPWSGRLDIVDDLPVLRTPELTLWLDGLATSLSPGTELTAGSALGHVPVVGGIAVLRIQLCRQSGRPPFFVPAALATAWSGSCPNPLALLGISTPASDDSTTHDGTTNDPAPSTLLERRAAAFAVVQEHYYDTPPQIERGWQHNLFDVDGRCYLDMVNNVAILGHGHPRITNAVAQQWQLLNTNSRFHYSAVVEFAERLASLAPDPLDTVFLVNSGTEANDLALRLAWANTGRRDVVAVREAYHGWSDATDAVSTSVADNPNALASRPAWVHTVAAPNSYRGQYRAEDAHRYATDAVATIKELVAAGHPPAAFLAEPYYGNAGGMALPDGYLEQIYAGIRGVGGLCIADEVQVGYGRLGEHFWGFEQQQVRPDIITVAKAMGNGHPLGAVLTTRAIADGFRGQGYFFSSPGGSPVSCQVGLAVLDVLESEGLQANARTVGNHLRGRLLELAERHPLIGAVHGMGLYLGVELVRDRSTLEPATAETAAICDRMRELGVIMQPTSDRLCVLKIKPPLVLPIEGADFFVDALDQVLTDGW